MRDLYFRWANLLGCLFLSGLYLELWVSPGNPQILFISFYVLFCEVLLSHLGLITMIFSRKIFVPILILFCIAGFFLIRNQFIPPPFFIVYTFIVLVRLRFDFYEKSLSSLSEQAITSFRTVFIFFICYLFVTFFPLPSFGLSSEYLEGSKYFDLYKTPHHRISGSRLTQEEVSIYHDPVALICLGVLYFASIALFEYRTIQQKLAGKSSRFQMSVMDLLGGLFRNRR